MLTSTTEMLKKAQEGKYAVGHFNASDLESAQAIIAAAVERSSPVIVATSVKALEFAGTANLGAIIRRLAAEAPVPVALHLDHGPDIHWVQECLSNGWTSIMIDASAKPFAENAQLTRQVVELCRNHGVPVEAELGQLKGVEDWVVAEKQVFTDPLTAQHFIELTGCSSLAVAIGTSHGAYKFSGESKLDFERLAAIREQVSVPLVLHGASGVPQSVLAQAVQYGAKISEAHGVSDQDIVRAISLGICKVNTDTDLRLAFTAAGRKFYAEHPENFDPRAFLGATRDAVKALVAERISLFGSAGKA